jgi:SAM-dependent methyltransferase
MSPGEAAPDVSQVLEDQIAYYRRMAATGQFDRAYARTGRYDRGDGVRDDWNRELDEIRRRLRRFAPAGEVVELACGSGMWTRELAASGATRITAVDAAPEMLRLNRERVGDARVEYVLADVLSWAPARRFDCAVFGLWLSHVPPGRFAGFWERLRGWLAPGGRVFFVDSLFDADRTARDERLGAPDDVFVTRRLDDGREYRIVKVFHTPPALAATLRGLGWEVEVRSTGRFFFTGEGRPLGRPGR